MVDDMSNKSAISLILKDIEDGKLQVNEILKIHNITIYKYHQIKKIAEVKKPYVLTKVKKPYVTKSDNQNKRKPKKTKFKSMLEESSVNPLDASFNLEGFKEDCKSGVKISELMEKYGLSLYQVRELRKQYDLKTK